MCFKAYSLSVYAHKLELSSNCSPGRTHRILLLFVIYECCLPHLRLTQLSLEIFEHLIFTSFREIYRRLALCLYSVLTPVVTCSDKTLASKTQLYVSETGRDFIGHTAD